MIKRILGYYPLMVCATWLGKIFHVNLTLLIERGFDMRITGGC
jgi:hypothetical protein